MHTHNKRKYQFAMSSFVRMYGNKITHNNSIKQFCVEWSGRDVDAPLSGLEEVDQYFYHEYKTWKGQ